MTENCANRVNTNAWVPLEHMLGITNKSSYFYCIKYKCECTRKMECNFKERCVNCNFPSEGFYCKLCNFILNRNLFESRNQNLKLATMDRWNTIEDLYSTNLHVIDMDKTIEWLKTFNPKKKVTLVYNRYWSIVPSPGYHLVYDYKEIFDSYIRLYE